MLKNLKIRFKLLLGFGFIALAALVIGITNFFAMRSIENKKVDLLEASEISDALSEAKFNFKSEEQLLMEIIESSDYNEIKLFWEEYKQNEEALDKNLGLAIEILSDNGWGKEFKADKDNNQVLISNLKDSFDSKIKDLFSKVYEIKSKNDTSALAMEKIWALDKTLDKNIELMIAEMYKSEVHLRDTIENYAKENMHRTIVEAQESSMAIMIISLIVAMLFSYLISNIIVKPINGLKGLVSQMSQGNMNHSFKYNSRDEVGEMAILMHELNSRLREIIGTIKDGANDIQGASEEISAGAQQMSQTASETAASIEEISSSVEQMYSNIQQNAENAKETEKIAIHSAEVTSNGNKSVQIALNSMNEIAEKITIINDIAFQTNILALNAAVEAARAGEHGKGFAVVASEVRKLAEHSKHAADEIDTLSNSGVSISKEAGLSLDEVVPQIKRTAALVQEITAASVEQSTGTGQIGESVQQLNEVAQQNASASEELASTAEELNSQADQLREKIAFFKL